MAGKITFPWRENAQEAAKDEWEKLHESRQLAWQKGYSPIAKNDFESLGEALGKSLNETERDEIQSGINQYSHMRDRQLAKAEPEDVNRTLEKIMTRGDQAIKDYQRCDEETASRIRKALIRNIGIKRPVPGDIHKAAKEALEILASEQTYPGAHAKGYQVYFVEWCVNTWERMGGKSLALGHDEAKGDLSPILNWTTKLLSLLESRRFDWRKAQRLLSPILKR